MSDEKPSIAELQRVAPALKEMRDTLARIEAEPMIHRATPALLEIAAAAQAFHERLQTADFEDDTKPARQALFAALAKVRR